MWLGPSLEGALLKGPLLASGKSAENGCCERSIVATEEGIFACVARSDIAKLTYSCTKIAICKQLRFSSPIG